MKDFSLFGKKYNFYGKNSGLGISRTKDWVVMGVCLLLYALFIAFMLSSSGGTFFDWLRRSMPFMNLLDSTLSDMDKMLGLLFEKFGMSVQVKGYEAVVSEITFPALLIDLTKVMMAAFFRSLIFTGFSYLFLHAGNFDIVKGLIGGESEDFLYCINSWLLNGIAMLLGVFGANWIMSLASKPILALEKEAGFWTALGVFVVAYILFSIYFMIRAKASAGGGFSLRRVFIKTTVFNLIPEILTLFVTNFIIVFVFSCFTTYKFHPISIFAFLILLFWAWLNNVITGWLKSLFVINPFCGKNCPISGILWLPATVSLLIMFYFMALPNLGHGSNPLEGAIGNLPFLEEFSSGLPVFNLVIENLAAYKQPLLSLFFICNMAAVFQYLTSSYTFTLFTQIIVRFVLMGFALVFLGFAAMVPYLLNGPVIESIQYMGVAAFFAVVFYIFYAIWQPYLALQGILTTALILAVLQWLPGFSLWVGTQAITVDGLGFYLWGSLISIGLNLLLSLAQNLATFFEKKFWIAKKLIK